MDIRSGKEIISEFIERYSFSHIFVDESLPFGKDLSPLRFNPSEAVEFLLSSALTGCKVIGFFNNIPEIEIKRPLRGEFILIGRNIPKRIDVPTLFCRSLKDMENMLISALKAASDSKMPVAIIIADSIFSDYTDYEKPSSDLARTSPYLHANTFKTFFDKESFENGLSTAASLLEPLWDVDVRGDTISFHNSRYPFFGCMLPSVIPSGAEAMKGGEIKAPESEVPYISQLLNGVYSLGVTVTAINEDESLNVKDFLCPGCPIVSFILRVKKDDTILFTDVQCEGVHKAFEPNIATIEEYMGLLSDNLNIKTVFIGFASSYKPCYDNLLKHGKVVFLNDCNINEIKNCLSVRHPKKLVVGRNFLFPYSCGNIKRYSKVKVNVKKCLCGKNNEPYICMERTKCPAIYTKNSLAAIDIEMCNGCLSCKVACPFGAIS